MNKKKLRPAGLRLWLSAIDPGQVRLLTAGRAALALLSIWLVLRNVVIVLSGGANPTIPLFGVQAGMVLLLFIIDLKPSDHAACGNCSSTSVIYDTRWGGIFDSSVAAKLTDTEITERCMKLFKNQVFMNNIPFQRFRHVPLEMVVKELIDLEWSPAHPKELRFALLYLAAIFLEREYLDLTL